MNLPTPLTATDANGDIYHAVGVHILPIRADGKVLLGLRSENVALAPGLWSTVCGKLENENVLHGAARELREVTGLVADPADLRYAHTTHFQNQEGHGPAFAMFFTVTKWTGDPEVPDAERHKCDGLDWFALDDLPRPIVGYVANAMPDIDAGLHNGGLGCGFSTHNWPELPPATAPPGARLPYETFVNRLPRVVAYSSMLITDQAGRVLLVMHTYGRGRDGVWSWPGGGVDDQEGPRPAARREIKEELGLDIKPGVLLATDVVATVGRPSRHVFVFDGGTLTEEQVAAIAADPDEIAEVGFFTPEEAAARLPERAQRRLAAVLAARNSGTVTDLYDGYRPTDGRVPTGRTGA